MSYKKPHGNKGKKRTKEQKLNISKAHIGLPGYWKGKTKTKEHVEKCANTLRKRYKSGEIELNSGTFKKGGTPHNKGKIGICSEETIKKMSDAQLANPNRYWLGKEREDLKEENHFNWKGDNDYGGKFTYRLKEKIRKRDNCKCQECGLDQENHFRDEKKCKLSVHHIDFNKKNNKENNLLTVCNTCHRKLHKGHMTYNIQKPLEINI